MNQLLNALLAASLLLLVIADYEVTINLTSFSTTDGQREDGRCCDFPAAASCGCWACFNGYSCDMTFKICLESHWASGPNDYGSCSTGFSTSDVLAKDSNLVKFGNKIGTFPNPTTKRFIGPTNNGFQLKLIVEDDDIIGTQTVTKFTEEFDVANMTTLELGKEYLRESKARTGERTTDTILYYTFTVACSGDFEGERCEIPKATTKSS